MTSAEDRAAVLEEVRLIIIEAVRDSNPVRADGIAKIVAYHYPRSGLTSSEIAERIKDAADAVGVPVEPWRRSVKNSALADAYLLAAVRSPASPASF